VNLRTNQHFTLKQNPLRRHHLDEFVDSYLVGKRDERTESVRWQRYAYDDLLARDKVNLDITWLRDESLEDADNLPAPEIIAPWPRACRQRGSGRRLRGGRLCWFIAAPRAGYGGG
jgi:hypothetical protein